MPTPSRGLIERLDAAAERTGIPQRVTGRMPRKHLRWLPMIPLGFGVASELLALFRPDLQGVALALETVAIGLAVVVSLIGPIKPWGSAEHADEFDRRVRGDAYFATFATMSGVALLGMWLLVGLTLTTGWPREMLVIQLAILANLLFVIYFALPTLHASWATRPIEEE